VPGFVKGRRAFRSVTGSESRAPIVLVEFSCGCVVWSGGRLLWVIKKYLHW
jgi:hypothetical protein